MAPAQKSLGSPLHAGVKALLTCDSGDVVSGIVDFIVSQIPVARPLTKLMHRGTESLLATAMIMLNGLRCFVGVDLEGSGAAIIVARRPNERRAIDHLRRMDPDREIAELAVRWRPAPVMRALAALLATFTNDCRRTFRLTRSLTRRYGVFRAMRVVELVAYYRRYSQLLAGRPFQLAVMSSHSNPHGIALNLVAQRYAVPIVLITHGMPVRPLARLEYDVAIHECDASKRIYEEAGCRMTCVVIKSRWREHAPMRLPVPAGNLTIGLFLSKDPVEPRVLGCVRALLGDPGVTRIVVRPHPVNLWRNLSRCMASLGDPRVTVHSGAPLSEDLRQCDLVIAGNSTVLLDAVVSGCPACYVRGFDHGPYDVQDFVGNGLVYEWQVPMSLNREAIARYYRRGAWPRILRRYAEVDRHEDDVAADVRAALNAVSAAAHGEAA